MTHTLHTAARMALDALIGVLDDAEKVVDLSVSGGVYEGLECKDAITALREALAQPAAEPVAWFVNTAPQGQKAHWEQVADEHANDPDVRPLYAAPPAAPAPSNQLSGNSGGLNLIAPAPVVPAKCDGGTCGLGGYCVNCPKQIAAPVVPLTDKQINNIADALLDNGGCTMLTLARAIEKAHGIVTTEGAHE